ncbi:phosphatase PAP2 family protein [Vibrio agarivorans]|uniref:Phosphatase PAP2 family protein n=1 Tax=Vibrio agarivorans TaxID=153622 RepID=A0ABT7Y6T9_9VIBR|nr:phosphatase PAP2 family protein [Vibrio agarivorans]MDN2483720.1 phosphatase PAP2 family protein [Vibrio agarivorans]
MARFVDVFKKDCIFYVICFLCSLINIVTLMSMGFKENIKVLSYSQNLDLALGTTILTYLIYKLVKMVLELEPRPLKRIALGFAKVWQNIHVFLNAFCLITATSMFLSTYSSVKALIPIVNEFKYDNSFYLIDKYLFMGHLPHDVIGSVIDGPYFYSFINLLYNVWFLIVWGALIYFCLHNEHKVRMKYLITCVLCWFFIGNIAATFFSSAGPVYIYLIDNSKTMYLPLIEKMIGYNDFLIEVDYPVKIWALGTQDMLWDSYINNKHTLGSGISAMPSMHVSMSVLFALGASQVSRLIGYIAWVYCFFIYIGSFMLGWHYAVDGLVSVPLTLILWKFASFLVDKSTKESVESGEFSKGVQFETVK